MNGITSYPLPGDVEALPLLRAILLAIRVKPPSCTFIGFRLLFLP
jgi:hypothetical protein